MPKTTIQRKLRAAKVLLAAIRKSLSRRVDAVLSWFQQPTSYRDARHMLIRIPQRIRGKRVQQALNDHIELLRYIGLQVQVLPLQEQIPTEYIGIEEWWRGARLESRAYLKIREERVVKKFVETLLISE